MVVEPAAERVITPNVLGLARLRVGSAKRTWLNTLENWNRKVAPRRARKSQSLAMVASTFQPGSPRRTPLPPAFVSRPGSNGRNCAATAAGSANRLIPVPFGALPAEPNPFEAVTP